MRRPMVAAHGKMGLVTRDAEKERADAEKERADALAARLAELEAKLATPG